jgi:hypothetical protein
MPAEIYMLREFVRLLQARNMDAGIFDSLFFFQGTLAEVRERARGRRAA